MTRINLVDPSHLVDKHLLAEYRELPRVFTLVKKSKMNGHTIDEIFISPSYVLGEGHVRFFYNKLVFLLERYRTIVCEMKKRNFVINEELVSQITKDAKHLIMETTSHQIINWQPTPEEIYLNMLRITSRYFETKEEAVE